jgi:hypothetical protein
MKILLNNLVFLLSTLLASISASAEPGSPDSLAADDIVPDCRFLVNNYGRNLMDIDKYNVSITWQCANSKPYVLDSYSAESTGPQIVTVFYTKKRDVIALLKWQNVNSKSSDTAHYKVFAYRYVGDISDTPFIRLDRLMERFGDGFDGIVNGKHVEYPFKNAASIRKRLAELEE